MSVGQKIQAVMKTVGNMAKDKQMAGGGNYWYLSEEKVTSELHKALAEHGLVVFPTTMAILDEREDTTSSGKIMHNVRIQSTYRFVDADEPESGIDVMVLGEGSDIGDKVLNKCMTAAYKYALRQTFMISTGDDPDDEVSQEATSTQKRKPAGNAKPKPAGDTVPCEWPGCDGCVKATDKYPLDKLVAWSKEKCDGQVFCYNHKQAWEAGERPEEDGTITAKQTARIHILAANIWGKTKDALTLYKVWLGKEFSGLESSKGVSGEVADEIIGRLEALEQQKAQEEGKAA